MKYLLLLLIPVITEAAPTIDYGTVAKHRDYPSVVKISLIHHHNFFGLQEAGTCTGSLISPKVVLTAAHCVNTFSQNHSSVSLAGDEKGQVLVNGKDHGIKVVNAYVHPSYGIAKNKYDEAVRIRMSGQFIQMTPEQREKHEKKIQDLALEMSKVDIAVMELEKSQKILRQDLARIACNKSLRSGSAIEYAGFGRSRVTDSLNSNTNYVLLYGKNHLAKNYGGLYMANASSSQQLINSGDSGGPLYSANNALDVYGISVLRKDGEMPQEKESIFVNLTSPASRQFFQALYQSRNVSKEVRESIGDCSR